VISTFNQKFVNCRPREIPDMATASDVLAVAASQVGYYAPPGSSNKYGLWYGLNFQPWCAEFVSWVAAQAGATDIIPKHAWTPSGAAWFQGRGQWHGGTSGAARGDVVYYNFSGAGISHVGLVESVNSDGSLNTIEGNTGGTFSASQVNGGLVARKRRLAYIVGFGRPAYAGPPPVAPAVPAASGLAADGDFGPLTCMALQRVLGVGVDGSFGPITKRALQSNLGVVADGFFGPISTRALQARLGVSQDGSWGPITTRALQVRLNAGTF
jgi:peptidoglycan hydrolase-like protein with peptidoglycan-binding domain